MCVRVAGALVRCSFTVKKDLLGDKIRKKKTWPWPLPLKKKKKSFGGHWPKPKFDHFFFFKKGQYSR